MVSGTSTTSEVGHESGGSYVIFRGSIPQPGEFTHKGEAVAWAGDDFEIASMRRGRVLPTDRVVSLQGSLAGVDAWMLVRLDDALRQRVLVVEDTDTTRDYYIETLGSVGIEAYGAENGEAALALAEQTTFVAVFCDIRLPDANGFELARSMAGIPGTRGATITLMSADPAFGSSRRLAEAGANGFIVNPIAPDSLRARVGAMLGANTHRPITTRVSPGISLSFFGEPAIHLDGQVIRISPGRPSEIIATLAADCPASVSTDQLARLVGQFEPLSSNAIYTAMSRLRSQLADDGVPELVINEGTGYALSVVPDQVDLSRFEEQARSALAVNDAVAITEALSLWKGRPFASTGNPLLTRWATRIAETRAVLMQSLAVIKLETDLRGCIDTCQQLLEDEPWREHVWVLYTVALYRRGRVREALEACREAASRLRTELGLEPCAQLAALEGQILNHDPILQEGEWEQDGLALPNGASC